MNKSLLIIGSFCLSLTSCKKEPALQHRFTPEQQSWQGYQLGEVLRFGHGQNSQVRTYRVTDIQDRMEQQYVGFHIGGEAPFCQHITVLVQRTDSATTSRAVLDLQLSSNTVSGTPVFGARAEWESFTYAPLPLTVIISGMPIDTTSYEYPNTKLLLGARFGPTTYPQVIRVGNVPPAGVTPLGRSTRRLYYARGKGVIAFEEAGNDLWYRLL